MVKRVFLAGRLKYSLVSAKQWRTQLDIETLLRAMIEIVEGWGGVRWARMFDNMKLGRDATGQPRWNPAFWRFATEVGCHPKLCEPGAGQQKGSVANLVKWVKTNFLPGRSFADDEDLALGRVESHLARQSPRSSQAHGQRPGTCCPGAGGLRAADGGGGLRVVPSGNGEPREPPPRGWQSVRSPGRARQPGGRCPDPPQRDP